MRRALASLIAAALTAAAFAIDELPAPDESQPLEIEPPLLIQNRSPDGSLPDVKSNAPGDLDVAKLQSDLTRAKKNAASGERLYKAGIIAKVEAEERTVKVARLEAQLADAELVAAKTKLEELKSAGGNDEAFTRELKAAEALVAGASATAERAAAGRRAAEVEAAARNVERQQKLLALGSGRKADVSRAQEKLAKLQQPGE